MRQRRHTHTQQNELKKKIAFQAMTIHYLEMSVAMQASESKKEREEQEGVGERVNLKHTMIS